MDQKIAKADWLEWKQHPVTRKFRQVLEDEIEDLKEDVALGRTVDVASDIRTAMRTQAVVTRIAQLRDILRINEVDVEDD